MTPFLRRLTLLFCLLPAVFQPTRADEPVSLAALPAPVDSLETALTETAAEREIPTEGIALSARGEALDAFRLDVWKLEHEQIRAIRATRRNPTERGMWYSHRSREEKIGRKLSDAQFPLVGAGLVMLGVQGREGRSAALAGAKSLIVTGAITMGIKRTFLRRRPYPNDDKFGTFPSGHTSTTFAMAGIVGAANPRLRLPALLAAGGVGWSRLKVRAHHWPDVIAGAALGLVVSNQFKPDRIQNSRLANFDFKF